MASAAADGGSTKKASSRKKKAGGGDGGGWTPARSVAGNLNPWLIVAIISLPTFMEVLDTSIANVALDHIAGGLSISSDQATWVLTSYLVANAVVIPISGWLSDAIGRKRYFLISIALFTASSFLCGISPNLTMLVLARVFQGIGGGGLAPVEQSMLADTFPPEKRGTAFAAFAIVVVVGPVLGPMAGGWIVEYSTWHWIFLINVPVGIAAFFLVSLFVDEPEAVVKERKKKLKNGLKIDYVGVILVALALGCLEITVDRGQRLDWFSSNLIITTATICGLSLIGFVIWELNHPDPVVNLKLLGNRNFAATLMVMMTTGLILFGTTQLIPQMLQQVLGYSALDAGLALTLGGIATLVAVPFAGQVVGKVDVRFVLGIALAIQAGALWNLSHFTDQISFMDAAMARFYQAMALPFLFVPISAIAYNGLKPSDSNQASSLLNVARNLGGTFGIAFAQVTLARQMQRHQTELVWPLNGLNPNFNNWLDKAGQVLPNQMSADGSTPTLGALYQQVVEQSSMLAFLDVFRSMMVLVLIFAPVILFLKPSKNMSGGGAGH